jgi:hypothetical protein
MYYFLTNAPVSKKIRETEWEELSILCRGAATSVTGKIKCYRLAGTNATYSYAITASGHRVYLNVMTPVGETFSLMDYMEAWMEIESTQATQKRIFVCDHNDRKFTARIGWLNTLGGIDYYTFYGQTSSEAQIERTTYKRELPSGFTTVDRGTGILTSSYEEETEIVSDFETPETIAWLVKCLASPEVWIMEDHLTLIPIVFTSKSHVISQAGLVQLKLKYKKANSIRVQNG